MAGLRDPLLDHSDSQGKQGDNSVKYTRVTDYARAGILSKILFLWLNPVLEKGTHTTLRVEDVPILSPEHRATRMYEAFIANWPKQYQPNAVRNTLIKTFWKQFILTSLMALLRVSVLFIGPILIQSFVAVTSGTESFPFEGYVLVLVLFLAKTTEVTSSHNYQFNCQKLGILVRSALISAVYRKGLRLSSFARQSHGVGQIVNYMSVDVQQMSDVVLQLNNIWMVPAQIIVALCIVFYVTGVSAVAGLLVMVVTAVLSFLSATRLRSLQKSIMKGRDSRMRVTVEALTNMKIIKLQAWDAKFLENVTKARQVEYSSLTAYMYTTAFNIFIIWLTPLVSCVAVFACIVLRGKDVTATLAFTTIATVRIVQEPLRLFPQSLISISQAMISLERLDNFLWSEELDVAAVERLPFGHVEPSIVVEGGTFKWSRELEAPNLFDINLSVKHGSLVAIVGKVGSGKSSLLAALLGEMPKEAGMVKVSGSTAYVAQQAWIQSGTIQENILFGLPMNTAKYQRILTKCALRTDLGEMEFGDQTEIGERGLNLSGGQKQRIQLARAIYQDSDVYLLDDIFSAVDAHTGSDLFRDCILDALSTKTVLLVTHQIEFLPGADLTLVMRDGRIVQSGHYEDLLTGGTDFEALVEASNEALEKVLPHEQKDQPDSESLTLDLNSPKAFSYSSSPTSPFGVADANSYFIPSSSPSPLPVSDLSNQAVLERNLSKKWSAPDIKLVHDDESSARMTKEEQRESGSVSYLVYWSYFTRSYGGALVLLLLIVQTVWQVLQIAGDYWVAYGAASEEGDSVQTSRFVVIYAILAFSCGILVFVRTILVSIVGLTTGQSFYLGMLRCIFRAPMSFFDTTPTGRILSRASTDQATTDVPIPMFFGAVLAIGFQLVGVLLVTLNVTWQIVFLLFPLGWAYYRYQTCYFATSRELTRVDALTKAPIIHHFSETIAGFVTVRCFKEQDRFIQINVDRVDSNLRMDFHNQAATEWVGLRMELLGIIVLCASTLLLVGLPEGYINKDLVGLCLTYGMNLNGCLFVVAWMYCQLENKMVAIERIGQYTHLPSEPELTIEKTKPAPTWPDHGTIVMENLKLRYQPQAPLVLKGINVTIKGGHKVGVVGRTGSGKSTILLALFRLVEAAEGVVLIDNIDIKTLGLNDLRSRLSIIPQDPTLFDGTVRSNLDVLEEHLDAEIWEALEKCQLASNVKELKGKLDAPVLENGENWSLGQRQLFCLGRVLLKRTQILVLDEATASVDAQTDAVMQKIIRKEFDNSTVISIAHRIPTVMDSNKVLVLDAGKVREYASPSTLLDNPHSLFSSLVHEYSARSVSYSDLVSMDHARDQ
ncbi:unnamed protein product [Calypogeia fissa]